MIKTLTNKLAFLLAVVAATAVGGITTAVVMAAIPDSGGQIHACRRNLTGALRVIDSPSQSCNGLEAPLNWSQNGSGSQIAYARVNVAPLEQGGVNVTLNSANSSGIAGFKHVPNEAVCFNVVFTPKFAMGTAGMEGSYVYASGFPAEAPSVSAACGAGYNAAIIGAEYVQTSANYKYMFSN